MRWIMLVAADVAIIKAVTFAPVETGSPFGTCMMILLMFTVGMNGLIVLKVWFPFVLAEFATRDDIAANDPCDPYEDDFHLG